MPAWDSATETEKAEYTAKLQSRLQEVQCPASMVHCRDPTCGDNTHSYLRDTAVLDILLAVVETSYTTVPLTGGVPTAAKGDRPQQEVIPECSAEVEPYRLEATSCHRAWLAAGKLRQGEAQEARLRSHTQFLYAVSRVKRASKLHQAKGLFGAAMSGDVDGVTGDHEVAGKFREVYEALYNSSPSEPEMTNLKVEIQMLIQTEASEYEIEKLTADVVKEAVCLMKPHKMDISQGFSSDAILHAPDLLFSLLSLVLRDWLTHCTVTPSVLACAFIPLLKNSLKDPALTDSYRTIAGSSLLLNIFERCILIVWGTR